MGVEDVIRLSELSGTKAKQQFLQEHSGDEWFCKFLYYALNPMLTYNISKETAKKLAVQPDKDTGVAFSNIFDVCEHLSKLKGVNNSILDYVHSFLFNTCNEQQRDVYLKLLSKTLRLGVTAKTVNKIIPGLIPEWEVQQAFPIEKYPLSPGTHFWVTQKLNGVRATLYNGRLVGRSGAPFEGLDHILAEIEKTPLRGYVLDGELTLVNKGNLSDNEAFRVATGILNSDNVNKTEICFTIFDIIHKDEFDNGKSKKYGFRRDLLDCFQRHVRDCNYVRILPSLYNGADQSKIDELLEQMVAEDKEGLMINLHVPYKRTRHRGILKVKRFYTMDLPIVGYEEGTGRLEGTLGSLIVQYKNNEVKVGSGFSDEQRKGFWENRDSLIGVLCEVKYKEISEDKNTGLESLQFPVFVRLREDKTQVSFG